jgi:hypothetical protein
MSLEERFWAKVRKSEGCWEWVGSKIPKGYGNIGISYRPPKSALAHRVSWEIHFGPIPGGMFVCHHCDNPGCVRPDHLFLGTNLDNIRDSESKGRFHAGDFNRRKTHCKHGHGFTLENTWLDSDGWRHCRACWELRRSLKKETKCTL